jgi:hypothetical protein
MAYKEWILLTKEELSGIAIDCIDPEGKTYSEPFCFYSLDEALSYGKMCIDKYIRSKSLLHKGLEAV